MYCKLKILIVRTFQPVLNKIGTDGAIFYTSLAKTIAALSSTITVVQYVILFLNLIMLLMQKHLQINIKLIFRKMRLMKNFHTTDTYRIQPNKLINSFKL